MSNMKKAMLCVFDVEDAHGTLIPDKDCQGFTMCIDSADGSVSMRCSVRHPPGSLEITHKKLVVHDRFKEWLNASLAIANQVEMTPDGFFMPDETAEQFNFRMEEIQYNEDELLANAPN